MILFSGPQEIGDYVFPEPELQNVYDAWKPLDRGHPLVDVTIHYAPPGLERVHIGEYQQSAVCVTMSHERRRIGQ